MVAEWREFSTMTKVFYIASLVSAIGLVVMILTRMTSIGDVAFILNSKGYCSAFSLIGLFLRSVLIQDRSPLEAFVSEGIRDQIQKIQERIFWSRLVFIPLKRTE
jgi:hypothetical protein